MTNKDHYTVDGAIFEKSRNGLENAIVFAAQKQAIVYHVKNGSKAYVCKPNKLSIQKN
jgi:hypothetical protein